jgi:seryl-tRNA synthetase
MKVKMEDLKNFLSNRINLLLILVGLLLVFQMFSVIGKGKEALKVNYIKEEIQGLKDEVNEIYKSEKALDKKIDTFNTRIKNIHEAITINNIKIENLKKYEKVKVDNFKSYDARMYEEYFAERYSDKSKVSTIK